MEGDWGIVTVLIGGLTHRELTADCDVHTGARVEVVTGGVTLKEITLSPAPPFFLSSLPGPHDASSFFCMRCF